MIIPYQEISPETLNVIIEDWLTRQAQSWLGDSTELGDAVTQVKDCLASGKLLITWDEEMNSLGIVSVDQISEGQAGPSDSRG